jgi:hypothetical protein
MSEGIELLKGHVSFETAYVIPDYPYGRTLRCKRAVWVETHPRFGQRFVSRTTNPKKRGEVWNTPHADTYNLAVVLYRDLSDDHIKEAHLFKVWSIEETRKFLDKYGAALDDETREEIKRQLCDLIRKQSQDRSFTSTGYVPGTQVIQERVHDFPATISLEEAARLLAEYAPVPKPAPEPEPLGPLFGGQ